MANQERKQKHPWDRFIAWVHSNQKIIWVILLIVTAFSFGFVGPVQEAFTPSPQMAAVDRIYGEEVSQVQWRQIAERLGVVEGVLVRALYANAMSPLPSALQAAAMVGGNLNPLDYVAFQVKAERMGLRVPDLELADYVRVLYRRNLVWEEVRKERANLASVLKDTEDSWQLQSKLYQFAEEKDKELERQPFNAQEWSRLISAELRVKLLPADFEEVLRNVVLIAKLQEYVRSTVTVSPKDVFDEYQKDRRRLQLSWAEVPVTEELEKKVAATVTPEQIRSLYESEKSSFELPASIEASWLLLPEEHFKAVAAEKVTEEDLLAYLKENRNDYRRPVILGAEAVFDPRSSAEKEKLESELFYGLDDQKGETKVRDQVREKVIAERAKKEMDAFAAQLRDRLFPPKPPASEGAAAAPAKPATYAELVAQFGFLKAGSSPGFVSQADAKKAFGDAYGPEVERWFSLAARSKGRPDIKVPESALACEKGLAFYSRISYRSAMLPVQKEVEDKVRERVIQIEALSAIDKALGELSDRVNQGQLDLAAATAKPLEVAVGSEKVLLAWKPIQSTPASTGKYEDIQIEKPKDSKKDGEAEEVSTAEDAEDAAAVPEMEAIPASKEIVAAGFSLFEVGKTKGTSSSEAKAGYLVRLDGTIPPDPQGFEKARDSLERKLLSERQNKYYADWLTEVRREARGLAPGEALRLPGEESDPGSGTGENGSKSST